MDVGARLVRAIGAQDAAELERCFAPDATLRALIPRGLRERETGAEAAGLVASWFADATELELLDSRVEPVVDRVHVSYRFRAVEEGTEYTVEQQLYCRLEDGKIAHLDLLCSGFRPTGR